MRFFRRLTVVLLCAVTVPTLSKASKRSKDDGNKKRARGGVPEVQDEQLAIAGHISPFLSKFVISLEEARKVWSDLREAVNFADLVLLIALGFGMVPLARFIYNKVMPSRYHDVKEKTDDEVAVVVQRRKNFSDTYIYHAVVSSSQAARVGGVVYAFDVIVVILNSLGFTTIKKAGFSRAACKIAFSVWGSLRIAAYKRHLLCKAIAKDPDELGKAELYDRILNSILYVVTGIIILDMLDVDVGLGLQSAFAVGGMGTLILSLASKDLATDVVNGVALSTSEKFFEGDEIQLRDGTAGFVEHMDVMHTHIRGYDEITTKISNTQLVRERVRNITRGKKCQVMQKLWFSYKDINKISAILDDIKTEIKASCPDLISDGSRPFRAHWRDYASDHLEVVVDCHFNIKPTGDVYWNNRQKVLEAIAKAVEKNGAEFALPSTMIITANAS